MLPKPCSIIPFPAIHYPKRLPKRKRMTIGVGFVCTDGIVIAADTKEVYGDEHTNVHKLEIIDSPKCSGALAGSGYAYPVDYITPKIKALFESGKYKTADECESALSSLMALIYKSEQMKA